MNIAGVHPYDALVVEDSPKGIAAVRAAHMNLLQVDSPKQVTLDSVRSTIETIDNYNDQYQGK